MGNHVASVLYDMGEQLELGEIQRHTDWAEVPIAALLASSEKVEGEKCQGFHVLGFGGGGFICTQAHASAFGFFGAEKERMDQLLWPKFEDDKESRSNTSPHSAMNKAALHVCISHEVQ